jgi:hypothetical protein
MRRRIWAVAGILALGALAVAAAAAAGAGPTRAASAARQEQCPFTRNPKPGWQISFGRAGSVSSANALQGRIAGLGFGHTTIQPNCAGGYEVALLGVCPFTVAYSVQQEARNAKLSAILEYKKPADPSPDLVAVFGHFRTRAGAEDYKPRVDRAFSHVRIIQDGGCDNDWEVAVTGINTPAQGTEFAGEAKQAGFAVSIETN